MVAHGVVQVARDADALHRPHRVAQHRLSGEQPRIRRCQRQAAVAFAHGDLGHAESDRLEHQAKKAEHEDQLDIIVAQLVDVSEHHVGQHQRHQRYLRGQPLDAFAQRLDDRNFGGQHIHQGAQAEGRGHHLQREDRRTNAPMAPPLRPQPQQHGKRQRNEALPANDDLVGQAGAVRTCPHQRWRVRKLRGDMLRHYRRRHEHL